MLTTLTTRRQWRRRRRHVYHCALRTRLYSIDSTRDSIDCPSDSNDSPSAAHRCQQVEWWRRSRRPGGLEGDGGGGGWSWRRGWWQAPLHRPGVLTWWRTAWQPIRPGIMYTLHEYDPAPHQAGQNHTSRCVWRPKNLNCLPVSSSTPQNRRHDRL